MLRLNDYKKCLFDNGKVLKSQQRFKSENHEVYTENINKIALSCDDDKRIVTSDRIDHKLSLWIHFKELSYCVCKY